MKMESEIIEIVQDRPVEPMTLEQRKARGFCTCPLKAPAGIEITHDPEPCRVHPKHLLDSEEYNQSRRLFFFDDRRSRYVSWEDSVESMRQPRYAGATTKGLLLYTWMNLIRLLEALCYPTRPPAAEITEESADHLISVTGKCFPPDGLASLLVVARGGETEALCKVFSALARNTQTGATEGETVFTLLSTVAAGRRAGA